MKLISLVAIDILSTGTVFSQQTSKDTLIDYIKKESIAGKLDYRKMLVGYGGTDNKETKEKTYLYSIALWSASVKDLGITDINRVVKLWEEIHEEKAKKAIKNAIVYGFKME